MYSFRWKISSGKPTNLHKYKIVLLRINSTTNLIKFEALLLYNLYSMWMYSWLSNTYNDVCLYEKDTFLIWIWCMGLNITHDRFEVAFEFLFFLHFRHNFLILHSMEDWKVWKHLLKTCFEKKNCDATSTRVWSPALYRPSFFVQYPSLLQCDFLFVWNEIDLLPVLLGGRP